MVDEELPEYRVPIFDAPGGWHARCFHEASMH